MAETAAPIKVQTVFNRIEKKYLLPESIYLAVREKLVPYMEVDRFGLTTICNIYYDTDNNELVRRSIEDPVYKEKLRLRCYGVPTLDSLSFLEIKKKYDGVVNKRRVTMPLREAYEYLENGTYPNKELSYGEALTFKEMDFFIGRYQTIRPALLLCYDRIAMFQTTNPEFRITFDTNIRSRRTDLRMEHGSDGTQLLPQGYYLMETKIMDASPLWFTQLMSELSVYLTPFSKYGNIYKKEHGVFNAQKYITHRLENWERKGEINYV